MKYSDLAKAITELRELNQSRYDKELSLAVDKAPTIDGECRLHAPCDNYEWVDGVVYLGGQYLTDPYADKFDIGKEYIKNSFKLKMFKNDTNKMLEIFSGSTGKSWVENGKDVCFFYANVTKSELKLLSNLFPPEGKKIVLVSEYGNPDNAKTWKFSSKKLWNKYVDTGIRPVGLDLVTTELVGSKVVATSPYDKQEVRYYYIKPEMVTI
jgi:hypothetical protein